MWPVLLVFVATYALIAARRLQIMPIGRPAGALAGACAMVVLSALDPGSGLTPHEAFAAVEPNTIGLLLGMMLLAASLDAAGVFERAAAWVARRRLSPVGLLYLVTLGAGLASAVLLNDSVCVMLAPLVDRTARRAGLDRVPYLLALAMGANTGSALTLAGNPQNMLVAHLSGISYRGYLREAGPAALLGLAVTAATLHLLLRGRLSPRAPALPDAAAAPPDAVDPVEPAGARPNTWPPLACVALVSALFVLGANLAWAALGCATLAVVLQRRDAADLWSRVSWTVIVFFAALFVVVAGLQKTGLPEQALRAAGPHLPSGPVGGIVGLSLAMIAGCQIVSNVPFILLAESWIRAQPEPHIAWIATALVSTLAGNLTLLGSVANIIVVEMTAAEQEIGFRTYARVGVPVTLASCVAALGWLLLMR
jgi:Na+/H+ antiporter NhaD/arsenite permease-like protein